MPRAYAALFAAEKLTYHLCEGNSAIDAIDPNLLASSPGAEPFDVVISLAADGGPLPAHRRTLVPRYNAAPTIFGAVAALLGQEPLILDVLDSARAAPLAAYPAITDRDVLVYGMDNVLSCMVGLVLKSLAQTDENGVGLSNAPIAAPPPPGTAAYAFALERLTGKARRYLRILASGHRSWSVAWRFDTAPLLERGSATFRVLPSAKDHYYADPFPFRTHDADYIFVEDFDKKTGRGSISVARVDGDNATVPSPVLETGYHLSYPHVFRYRDDVWMIPESGDMHDVCLYRATKFPDRWTCESVLLPNFDGYDATILLRDNGPLLMFVAQRVWKSSGWDILSVFRSERLDGPWTPLDGGNPVMFDARYSRPAGAVLEHQGRLIRPVQDCSELYGGAVRLCQIERLDPSLAQTPIGVIRCAPHLGAAAYRGCHTYNYSQGLETIDIFDRDVAETVTAYLRPIPNTDALTAAALRCT